MKKLKKTLKPYANFLFEVGILAKTPRSGFRHLDGLNQSISEHLLRTTYVGFTLANLEQEKGEKVDLEKVIKCCLFHDLGEARASDLDYISQKYTKTDELAAINDAVKNLSFGNIILSICKEAEERITKESIIAKDADQIELLYSLKEIIDSGNPQAKLWIPPLLKRLKTTSAKDLAKQILKTDSNEWWFENKNDEYWVNGGKRKK
ncbi:MAG: HD domain-containing protein [Microgenomates group bacterium]|jgi:putative hydrolase of HD superfamily